MEKESIQKMSLIEDQIHLAKEKSKSDAEFYRVEREAAANKLLLTKEFLEMKRFDAMMNNQKVFFGPDIPGTFINTADCDNRDGMKSVAGTIETSSTTTKKK